MHTYMYMITLLHTYVFTISSGGNEAMYSLCETETSLNFVDFKAINNEK